MLESTSKKLLLNALAPSTRQAYTRALNTYEQFCRMYNFNADLPITIYKLSLFITFQYEKGLPASSILSCMSAISYFHKLISAKVDPTKSFVINQLMTGIKKDRPSLDLRKPMSLNIIHLLIDNIHKLELSNFENHLFKALFLFAFYFGLRIGEFTSSPHNLSLNQITVNEHEISLKFASYKHAPLELSPVSHKLKADQSAYCPVKLLRNYLSLRGNDNGPIFLLNTKSLTAKYFSLRFKQALIMCNLNPSLYAGHSFRIGAACYWASLGLSHIQIRRLGRWQSDAFLKYIRDDVNHPQ